MEHGYWIDYENVTLRPLNIEDIENLRVWRNEPKNTRYLSKIPFITKEMQAEWFERYLDNKDEICFAIVENQVLKRMVGSLSLHEFARDTCFLGKILIGDVEAHGRKVGVNASIAATKIAFDQLNIHTVNLHVFKNNTIAIKVYKEAGFAVVDEYETDRDSIECLMTKNRRNTNAQHE